MENCESFKGFGFIYRLIFLKIKMMMWKIVGVSKVSVLYIYIYIYRLFFKNPETPWNGTPKSAGIEIFHSTGQTKKGSETVLITMILTAIPLTLWIEWPYWQYLRNLWMKFKNLKYISDQNNNLYIYIKPKLLKLPQLSTSAYYLKKINKTKKKKKEAKKSLF